MNENEKTSEEKDHENRIRTLELGVYGDAKNEIPGLITQRKQDAADISEFKQWRKSITTKFVYFILGASTVISGIVWLIEQFVKAN